MIGFVDELAERLLSGSAAAVVGLDPRPAALPLRLRADAPPAERILAFYQAVLPAIAGHVFCVKPNVAFFECFGADGYRAYEQTCRLAHDLGLLVLGDIKRGDIGSTAEAYAEGHFRLADAVTVHPYLGKDSVEPFLKHCRTGKGVFVLVRTSNPGARDFQDLRAGAEPLCDHVARAVASWGKELPLAQGYAPVGAVVGATWPDELARLRQLMPQQWLLLPGVGAQGARIEDLGAAFDRRGLGALITQSRGVMQAFAPADAAWLDQTVAAAAAFAGECRAIARSRVHA
jgi:orotidine-5'-phosphate decarboxylase